MRCVVRVALVALTAASCLPAGCLSVSRVVMGSVYQEFDGGAPACRSCEAGGAHQKSFACSKPQIEWAAGNWNSGSRSFEDPLKSLVPQSDIQDFELTQVSITVMGVFNCRMDFQYNQTEYSVSLADTALHTWQEPVPELCLCANCAVPRSFETQEQSSGWPGYKYGGVNTLGIKVHSGLVCASSINLTLVFSRVRSGTSSSSSSPSLKKDLRDMVLVSVLLGVLFCLMLACGVSFCIIRSRKSTEHADTHANDALLGSDGTPRERERMFLDPQVSDAQSEADAIVAEIARKLGATDRETPGTAKQQRVTTLFKIRGTEIKLGPRIGKGSQGEVFRGAWRGTTVAVKKLPLTLLDREEILREFNREAMLMATLRHPNVLQFLGSCLIDRDVCIVSEFMTIGSLYRLLHLEEHESEEGEVDFSISRLAMPDSITGSRVLSWHQCLKMALDTAKGMLYLHNSVPQILHRDLKSHNLLVDEHFRVKISDFGLSKILEKSSTAQTMTSCGTAAWAAPEVLRNSRYTEKADVYSYGVVLWEFWTRKDPYEGMPAFQIIFAVGTEGLRPTIPPGCPEDFRSLMVDCWQSDHSRRPSFDAVVDRIGALAGEASISSVASPRRDETAASPRREEVDS